MTVDKLLEEIPESFESKRALYDFLDDRICEHSDIRKYDDFNGDIYISDGVSEMELYLGFNEDGSIYYYDYMSLD